MLTYLRYFITCCLLGGGLLHAQDAISGTVTDEEGEALIGVTVLQQGTSNGTVTDLDGNYQLGLVDGDRTVRFSYTGYAPQEIAVGNQTIIDVVLASNSEVLDEVVVVGFGTQKKSDVTGAVATANLDAFREAPNVSIAQSLQGSVPGLNVGQVTGAGQSPNLSVRGRTSINGNQNPFIVLDGIPYSGSLSDLNPNDIASISVLKDPSSKAIYGAQSANGVILIESKKGTRGTERPTVSYSGSYTTQTPSNTLSLLDREAFLERSFVYDWEAAYQAPDYTELKPGITYLDLVEDPELRKGFEDGTDYDWWEEATDPGYIMIHNVTLQGRTGPTSYLLSGGYTGQKGYIINDEFDRKTARINLQTDVTDWLTLGAQTSGAFSDLSGNSPTLTQLRLMSPLVAPTDAEGNFVYNPMGTNVLNPFLTARANDLEKRNTLIGNVFAEVDLGFLPGLSYRLNYGNTYTWSNFYQSNEYENAGAGAAYKRNSSLYDWTLDNILTYNTTLADRHNLDVTLLYGGRELAFEGSSAAGSNFQNLRLGFNDLNQAGVQVINSSAYEENYLYQMGRFNYDYDERYLLTATLRRDGFSGFAENEKTAYFPSVALGWSLASEPFFTAEAVDNLKLRASYGVSGNLVNRYASLARLNIFPAIVFGDGGSTSFGQSVRNLANPNLSWERTAGYNFGVDFSVLDYSLNGSVDYYTSRTSDLIFDVALPEISGFDQITTNVGEVQNWGVELNLDGTPVRTDNLRWRLNFNFSLNRNRIESLVGLDADEDGQEDDLVASGLFIGESINSIYSYEADGIIQLGDDVPDGFFVGTYRITDQNGDGKITPDDRVIVGREEPAYRFSVLNELEYGNFTFRFFLNSVQGGSNGYLGSNNLGFGRGDNGRRSNLWADQDYWTPLNPDAKYARLDQGAATDFTHFDPRSFVRLQDVTLSYRFGGAALDRIGVGNLKVYLSGKNLYTFTDWNGWDPETGDGLETSARPVLRGYSFGLDVSF